MKSNFAMGCACRTSSLRIFVQTLTGLRVTHKPVLRSLPHPTTFAPYPSQLQHQQLSRPFTAASSVLNSAPGAFQQPSIPQDGNSAGQPQPRESTPPTTVNTSAVDLDQAKNDGVILDLSPESLDALLRNDFGNQGESSAPALRKSAKHGTRTQAEKPAYKKDKMKEKKYKPLTQTRKVLRPKNDKAQGHRVHEPGNWAPREREPWQVQKAALKAKFPEGWVPRKRLSPDAVAGIKALNKQFPNEYTLPVLSKRFEVSPEAIRRILRSKWTPTAEQEERRQTRWFERGKQIWTIKAALGVKPPRVWRKEGIVRDPKWNVKRGPRTEWPYMPHWHAQPKEEPKSPQEKLSENLV